MDNAIQTVDKRNVDAAKTHCKHFVIRKKRYCRMTVKAGYDYCGEHQPESERAKDDICNDYLRITCPLDNKQLSYNISLHIQLYKYIFLTVHVMQTNLKNI